MKNEAKWKELEAIAPKDVVDALKKLAAFYDGTAITKWMADLYDPEIGGFYYSNSARDHEGYAPDLESTVQLLRWMQSNGALVKYGGSHKAAIPTDIADKIVAFAKNMQSSVDGCFYHPQWIGQTLGVARVGRDIGWGNSIMTIFDAQPDYDVPGGVKGIYGAATGVKENTDKPKPTRKIAADFSSSEAYSRWVAEFNATIKENSGRAHEMNAMYSEIRGKGYVRETLDFLDRVQEELYREQVAAGEEPTGLWQRPINYHAVWGLLKYMPFYNDAECGRPIKYAKEIVRTCIKVVAMPPDGNYYMNDMMNQWTGVCSLLGNVKKYDPELLPELYGIARENAAMLVENSLEKIKPFKRLDGSFSYRVNGHSLDSIYGTPISLGLEEGDVNATGLCCSMYRGIFTCLGYTAVPLCDADDGEMFIDIIKNKKPVTKKPVPVTD